LRRAEEEKEEEEEEGAREMKRAKRIYNIW